MTFDWKELGVLADNLLTPAKTEAEHRTVVNRNYYCAFNVLRIICEAELGYNLGRHDVHKEVITFFSNHASKDFKSIGTTLLNLRNDRQDADYSANKKIDSGKSYSSKAKRERIYHLISEYNKNQPNAL